MSGEEVRIRTIECQLLALEKRVQELERRLAALEAQQAQAWGK